MAAEVEPRELADLLNLAERPRVDNWSSRAALTRYAQPQPQRASDVIELIRRTEFALSKHSKLFERDGASVWQSLISGEAGDVVDLLRAAVELDRLGDVLATWASNPRASERPDAAVDDVVADVAVRLEEVGVPREERPRPTGGRRGRG